MCSAVPKESSNAAAYAAPYAELETLRVELAGQQRMVQQLQQGRSALLAQVASLQVRPRSFSAAALS